jgi:hypothetical protein
MREDRRTFFGTMAAGAAAAVGLLIPGRASACFRRRVVCAPPPPPPCEAFGPAVAVRAADERAAVNINYPDELDVYGGGGMFAWGTTNGVSGITADCGAGTVAPIPPPAAGVGGTPNTWAFRIDGLRVGVPVTLNVYYSYMGSPRLGQSWTFTPH